MKKYIIIALTSTLIACSSAPKMTLVDLSPRGISMINTLHSDRAKAFRTAEKHCSKYYKVPRILKSIPQAEEEMQTLVFECLRPNR